MNVLVDFWKEIVAVWRTGLFGATYGDIFLAIGIFVLFLLARRMLFRTLMNLLVALARRTETQFDELMLTAIEKPLEFGIVVLGLFIAGQFAPFSEPVREVFDHLIRSFIAFTIFWTFYRLLDPFSHLFDRAVGLIGSASMHATIKGFVIRVFKVVIVCLGAASIFQEWGFNVVAVLGSLGLVGMAVALGAQEFIKNMFAGLTIFIDRMFEKGNWIKTPDVEGIVEDIGFRSTTVRRFDKALVTIPNSKLAGEALINFSRMTNRRIYWTIGVEYRTTHEQLRAIVKDIWDYVHRTPDFETDPAKVKTFVFIDAFGPSSIDIMLYCFTKTTDWGEWLAVKQSLALAIKGIVEGHGASFAFPSSSIYVEKLPFGKPETFPLQQGPDDGSGKLLPETMTNAPSSSPRR